jgi:hypothetical protein
VACVGYGRDVCSVLGAGGEQLKRDLGRTARRCEDNVKVDFKEIRWESVDWIDLAQDTDRWRVLVNQMMKLWVL